MIGRGSIERTVILFFVTAGLLQAGLLVNGSFESPVVGSYQIGLVGSGWTGVSAAGLFLENYSIFSLPTVGGAGNQAQGFGASGVTTDILAQTFNTTPGDVYHVQYQFVIQQGSELESFIAAAVDSGNNILNSDTEVFSNTAWVTKGFDFTADTATSTLRFSDNTGALPGNLGNFTNWALDAVDVTQLTGIASPEPSGLALLGLASLSLFLGRPRLRG